MIRICANGDLTSHIKCSVHPLCPTVRNAWPAADIERDWRLGVSTPLLQEATSCRCGNMGQWLCLRGGHMQCGDCPCHEHCPGQMKKKWLNPFRSFYHRGLLLHQGERGSFQNTLISYTDAAVAAPPLVQLLVRAWQYPLDRFPQILTGTGRVAIAAWRVSVEVGPLVPFTLHRCQSLWQSGPPHSTLGKAMALLDAKNAHGHKWTLISHPFHLFMYFQNADGGILCLGCRTVYPNLLVFKQSPCHGSF